MKTIIYSSFDCLIKGEEFEENLDANSHLSFDECPKTLFVYPIGKTFRASFEINFDTPNSQFYRIVKKGERLLVFLLDGIVAKSVKIVTISTTEPCQVEISKSEVVFSCTYAKKILTIPDVITSSTCGNFHHLAYALLSTKEQDYCAIFNTKNFNAKVLKGEKIELTDEGFVLQSSCFGYDKMQEEYIVTKEGLKIKDRAFNALSNMSEKTLAYRFLNALRLADYSSALSMLADNLSHLSATALREYFGNISYIFPLTPSSCFAIANNKSMVYSFSIQNGKIAEISDEE